MNKRQVISSLNIIAEELDNQGLYVEAKQITNVMTKIAQVQNVVPPQNEDELFRQTNDMQIEFMQKVPRETVYRYTSNTKSDQLGYLFIFDNKNPNAGPKKMSLQQDRQFIDNGFK